MFNSMFDELKEVKYFKEIAIKLYIGNPKYWNFQSEAEVEQITATVTTHSVSC